MAPERRPAQVSSDGVSHGFPGRSRPHRRDRFGPSMSIGRRLLNMARSELNSLLDIAAQRTGQDDDEQRESLHGYSASELEEELERRRSARQEVEDAIHGRKTAEPPPSPKGG